MGLKEHPRGVGGAPSPGGEEEVRQRSAPRGLRGTLIWVILVIITYYIIINWSRQGTCL